VEEAELMLEALAAKGHLTVTVDIVLSIGI
jgi:hypothetical protein